MSATTGILRLGDLTPVSRPIEVIRAGAPVTLWAWPDGPHCPGAVKSKVAAARRIFSEAAYADATDENGAVVRDEQGRAVRVINDDDDEHWHTYLTDVLLAFIDGLLYPEAEVLAGNQQLALDTLIAFGWATGATTEAAAPEAPGEESSSTTADSSPVSLASTASRRTRS